MKYKLLEPQKKPLGERLPFYLFAAFLTSFLVWIMLINPMSKPADQMPFIFEYNAETKEVYPEAQKRTYFLLTGGAMLAAALFLIPVIRNDLKHDYALAKLWANREYLKDDEFSELIDLIKPSIIKSNGADEMLRELQVRVDRNGGKHITGHKYFKKQYIKDLEKA